MTSPDRAGLQQKFETVRRRTETLTAPLSPEDCTIQSMPDVSPTKWHMAHTTWFFEAFLLDHFVPGYPWVNEAYNFLFNSYYEAVGPRHARPRRGLLSRPSLDEVKQYRRAVDGRMQELIAGLDEGKLAEAAMRIELGLNHEEQHQELLLMDIKHVLAQNPIRPAYQARPASRPVEDTPLRYERFDGGLVEIGSTGDGFCFDNETPRHKTYLEPFELAHRLVRNRDWLEFIADGGYTQAGLWLSDGWAWVNSESICMPEYWI